MAFYDNYYSFHLFTAEMLSIQQGLECVTEHLTEGTQLIDQLQQPDMDSHGMASLFLTPRDST